MRHGALSGRAALVVMVWALAAVLAGGVRPSLAADVWRLAGTFNGWNNADGAWALTAVEGRAGVLALERRLQPGAWTFKFVRNGNWNDAHFGMSGAGSVVPVGAIAGGGLEQPGGDIPLRIDAEAVYRVELDTNARAWSLRVADVDAPVVVAGVIGRLTVDGPEGWGLGAGVGAHLSLARSIGDAEMGALRAEVLSTSEGLRAEVVTGHPLVVSLRATRVGRHEVRVKVVGAGGVFSEHTEVVEAGPRYVVRWQMPEKVGVMPIADTGPFVKEMEAGVDGSWVFDPRAHPADNVTLPWLEVVGSDGVRERVVARHERLSLPAGAVVMVDASGRAVSGIAEGIVAGPTVAFSHSTGLEVGRVNLVGEFNGWQGQAGMPGAIAMAGSFSERTGRVMWTVRVPLAEGAYRYAYLLDGTRQVEDAAHPASRWEAGAGGSLAIVGPTREGILPRPTGELNARGVRHDPRSVRDFRVVSDGLGVIDLAVRTASGDAEEVVARFRADGGAWREAKLRRTKELTGLDRWVGRVMAGGKHVEYELVARDRGAEARVGPIVRTLSAPTPDVPDWAKGAVWYQIFPERFRNGNALNDPHGAGVFMMEWTADWYATQEGEEEAWRPRAGLSAEEALPARQGGELYHWVWDRRYGGDLQGVAEKLDWLADLGVTALYLNPVFEGESMHKYDATDYRHIDDNFAAPAGAGRVPERWVHRDETATAEAANDPSAWVWTAADRYFVDEFLPMCKARGIRVVIDGVFNHTGREHFAFQDVMKKGSASEFAGWFTAEFDAEGKLSSWVAWDGPSGWLPKLKQNADRSLVGPVRDHIFAITSRWMDPNGDGDPSDGIDGWRLDVALDVGEPFWEEWREHVKGINPEAVIIAEIWHEADPWLTGKHFDTQMHYPFAYPVLNWLGVRPGFTAGQLGAELNGAFDDAPQTNLIHQNLFGSHDTDRYVSMLFNPGREYDQNNRIQDNGPNYKEGRPGAEFFELSKLGVAIQATYVGAPMVYYGDEVGAWGADDPTDRKVIPWPDVVEAAGGMKNADEVFDEGLRAYYRSWLRLREDAVVGPVLRFGTVEHLDAGRDDVFAFVRELNGVRVYVVVNRGEAGYDVGGVVPLGARRGDGAAGNAVGGVSAGWWVFGG